MSAGSVLLWVWIVGVIVAWIVVVVVSEWRKPPPS